MRPQSDRNLKTLSSSSKKSTTTTTTRIFSLWALNSGQWSVAACPGRPRSSQQPFPCGVSPPASQSSHEPSQSPRFALNCEKNEKNGRRAPLIFNLQPLLLEWRLHSQSRVFAGLQQCPFNARQQVEQRLLGILVQFVGIVSAAGGTSGYQMVNDIGTGDEV